MKKLLYKSTLLITLALLTLFNSEAQTKKNIAPKSKTSTKKKVVKKKTYTKPKFTGLAVDEIGREYVDVIYLSSTKNSYIDIKGDRPLSADVGGNKNNIIVAVQENSYILKLKAVKKFPDANMLVVCKDTVLQFLLRYSDKPKKNYYAYNTKDLVRNNEIYAINKTTSKQGTNTIVNTTEIIKETTRINTITEKYTDRLTDRTVDKLTDKTTDKLTDKTVDKSTERYVYKEDMKDVPGASALNIGLRKDSSRLSSTEPSLSNKKENNSLPLKEEVFEKLPAKKVNINVGDLSGAVRVVLDRLYTDGQNYYYALTVFNRDKKEFIVDYVGFEVHRRGEEQSTNTDILKHEEAPTNNRTIAGGSKGRLLFSTGKVELAPEEFLLITLMEPFDKGQKEIKIKLKVVDFQRANDLAKG